MFSSFISICLLFAAVIAEPIARQQVLTSKSINVKAANSSLYIINGTVAHVGDNQHMCSLRMDYGLGKGPQHACGASIINQDWLLTSGHCILLEVLRKNANLSVQCGTVNIADAKSGQVFNIKDTAFTEFYTLDNWPTVMLNDIALVKINGSFTLGKDNVDKIEVAGLHDQPPYGATITTVGWGCIDHGETHDTFPDVLYSLNMPVLDNNKCTKGDYGGSATYKGKIVGVVSNGGWITNTFYPSIFTRIAANRNWITQVTGVFVN